MRVAVVVLGDLGRSPRMLYHAKALAARGVDVDLVGYAETALPDAIRLDPRVVVHPVGGASTPRAGGGLRWRYLVSAVLRGLAVFASLTRLLLWRLARPDVILVQNPPGVPVLLVAWVASRARSAQFVIDWHNLTYSMLSLRLGSAHPLVQFVKRYEGAIGRRADVNLFVSGAMREALAAQWQLRGVVFRDRPADSFQPIIAGERDSIRRDICARLELPFTDSTFAMAVSPTSWTADEDFDLLFEAVSICEALIRDQEVSGAPLPDFLILLTGRGPLRQHYERLMASRTASRIHLRTVWLEAGEYPKALAAADVGVCLHRSASGLDLPMKVADMFGAGIPVCALNYGPCLSEFVQHGANGLLFSTASELARQLYDVFKGFLTDDRLLKSLAVGVAAAQSERWQSAWNREVWPTVESFWASRGRPPS